MKYLKFCLIGVIALMLSSGSVKRELPSLGYYPGEMIPDIMLSDLKGNSHSLYEYKGKKVVVSFWATYHAQSRANNVQLYNYLEEKDDSVELVSVVFDENKNVVERTLLLDEIDDKSQFYEIKEPCLEIFKNIGHNIQFLNFLLDENGVIIAMNVTPEDLKTIL